MFLLFIWVFINYCPVIVTSTTTLDKYIQSASSKFKAVNGKPAVGNMSSVVGGRKHLRQCMKDCALTEGCLIAVLDSDLEDCSLYTSTLLTQPLSGHEQAVTSASNGIHYIGKAGPIIFNMKVKIVMVAQK